MRLTWAPHESERGEIACFAAAIGTQAKGWGGEELLDKAAGEVPVETRLPKTLCEAINTRPLPHLRRAGTRKYGVPPPRPSIEVGIGAAAAFLIETVGR